MEKKQDHVDRYGLIGRDIAYSFSRSYFASKFEKENIQASYVNFDSKTTQEVEEYLSDSKIKGYNVTIPYKQSVIPFLDRLDTDALAIGAVNTIKRTNAGELIGYNTDHIGFRESLLELCGDILSKMDKESLSKQAIILGTGGASKGVAYALETLGFQIVYVSRNSGKGVVSYADLNETHIDASTIIVNCTPLGTSPNTHVCPGIPYNHLTSSHIVYDLIYNPVKTLFLEKANEQGATIISGLRMLELQAEAAWDIWRKH
jgi:shikimate dehydrogenase